MKMNAVKILILSFVVFFTSASLMFAQDTTKSKTKKHETEMKMDSTMKMKMDMKGDNSSPEEYKEAIDLKSIDKNKDGKVYQCQMDYNVISDNPGKDPKCGMKLEKVTLKKAKANLINSGFKIK